MARPLSKYSFINAKLRARISKILSDDIFDELVKAPSLEAAMAFLRDTPFAGLEELIAPEWSGEPLVYARPGQKTARELLILEA